MKYNIFNYLVAVFFVTLFPFSLKAEEATEIPNLAGEQGEVIRVIWKDGREASAMAGLFEPLFLEVPLTLYENSCNEVLTSKCKLALGFQKYNIYFKWTKHPDPQKLGKTIRLRPKQKKTPKDENYFEFIPVQNIFGSADRSIRTPIAARNVPSEILICDNYNFLPKNPFILPYVNVLRWEVETMMNNPETGGAENRILGGALNVQLIPTFDGHLLLRPQYYTNNELVGGDIISLTMRDKNNQLCQVGMKPDLSEVTNKVQEYFSAVPVKFQSYYAGIDELYTAVFISAKETLISNQFELEP